MLDCKCSALGSHRNVLANYMLLGAWAWRMLKTAAPNAHTHAPSPSPPPSWH